MITDVKKRQGNYIEDFNELPEDTYNPQQPGNPQKSRSQEILESIYANAAPPPPVYNEQLQKRREKVARLNAAGRGFNVLGDVLSLATGANVQKRQPDQVTPAMLNSYQNYIQDYDNRTDRFNYQNYRDNLMNKRLLYQDAVRQEDLLREEKRYQDAQEWKKLGFKTEQEWREWQKQKAIQDQDLAERKYLADAAYKGMTAAERERHNRQMELARMIQAENTGKGNNSSRSFTIYDNQGVPVQLGENEREKVLGLILQDTNLTESELDLLSPAMGQPVSTNTMNMLVQKYWQQSQASRDYIQSKYGGGQTKGSSSIPSNWQAPRPAYQGPAREGGQQPAPVQQQPANTPTQRSTPGQETIDTTAINNKYQGIDITSGTPYEIALQVAEKQGIINLNVQPTGDQFTAIKKLERQIKQDADNIRAARVAEGVGIGGNKPQQQQSTGFDYGSLNFNLQ